VYVEWGTKTYIALCSIVETGRRNSRSALTANRDPWHYRRPVSRRATTYVGVEFERKPRDQTSRPESQDSELHWSRSACAEDNIIRLVDRLMDEDWQTERWIPPIQKACESRSCGCYQAALHKLRRFLRSNTSVTRPIPTHTSLPPCSRVPSDAILIPSLQLFTRPGQVHWGFLRRIFSVFEQLFPGATDRSSRNLELVFRPIFKKYLADLPRFHTLPHPALSQKLL
jgi:hypothetical protein